MPVPGLAGVVGVALTMENTCALLEDGGVWCWGDARSLGVREPQLEVCENHWGQYVAGPCAALPQRVDAIAHGVDIDAWGGPCVLELDGSVQCWGWTEALMPTLIPNVVDEVSVEDRCALDKNGGVSCWQYATASTSRESVAWRR